MIPRTPHARRFTLFATLALLILTPPSVQADPRLKSIKSPTGPARRWGAASGVGKYSSVNLQTGRVLTAIPVVGWGGRGPGISFTLYHHQTSRWGKPNQQQLSGDANFSGKLDPGDIPALVGLMLEPSPSEIDLEVGDLNIDADIGLTDVGQLIETLELLEDGPLWTHTYSTSIDIEPTKITILWGDGTKDEYTGAAPGAFTPPPGVFNTLSYHITAYDNHYELRSKSQFVYRFATDGKLQSITDPSGNTVSCHYFDNPLSLFFGKLEYVQDPAGRRLTLDYNFSGNIRTITSPFGGPGNPATRTWELRYEDSQNPGTPSPDGDGPFVAFANPLGDRLQFAYSTDWNIEEITDENDHAYALTYNQTNGRLIEVRDPKGQSESYAYYMDSASGFVLGVYTDLRGFPWTARFNSSTGNLVSSTNPLNESSTLTYLTTPAALTHEVASATNPLGKIWSTTYDPNADILTTTDPLGNRTTFTYDSLDRLQTVTPPGATPGTGNPDKTVQIFYDDPLHPTSPTRVLEPPALPGEDPSTTTMDYYSNDEPEAPENPAAWTALLHRVTDPNGVVTEYEYDRYGQQSRETENPPTGGPRGGVDYWETVVGTTTYNPGGMPTSTCRNLASHCEHCQWDCGGQVHYDSNGRAISADCVSTCYYPCQINPPDEPYQGLPQSGGCGVMDYLPGGQINSSNACIGDPLMPPGTDQAQRSASVLYDPLDRPELMSLWSDEQTQGTLAEGTSVQRSMSVDYDDLLGKLTATDQDGDTVVTETDEAGRALSISRGTGVDSISATFTYDAAGRLTVAHLGNGSRIEREYDDANRLHAIRHFDNLDRNILAMVYAYTPDGLIDSVTETDARTVPGETITATLDYTYDNRNRLIREVRTDSGAGSGGTGVPPVQYDISYTYDAGGNRLAKTERGVPSGVIERTTTYTYDVHTDDELDGGQHNNRLLSYEITAPGDPIPVFHERTLYHYGSDGNTDRLVRIRPGYNEPDVFWFYYNSANQLWLAVQGTAEFDEETQLIENPVYFSAYEYRYASGRQRYLIRPRDPNVNPVTGERWTLMGSAQWRDYAGESVHADYAVDVDPQTQEVTTTPSRKHLSGIGYDDCLAPGCEDDARYYHADQIGSTRSITKETTAPLGRKIYTAFGEVRDDSFQGFSAGRHGYAGAFGYESPEGYDPLWELGWLHVGERYYDPAAGRFMQRDPIGILGGLNVYLYVENNPLSGVDPSGKDVLDWWTGGDAETGPGSFWINVTGGRKSWMDDDEFVDDLSVGFAVAGLICATGAVGLLAAGVDVVIFGGSAAAGVGGTAAAEQAAITGFTRHGLNQVISRVNPIRGPGAILDAVKNPVSVILQEGGAIKYIGRAATVVLNAAGKVITAWP